MAASTDELTVGASRNGTDLPRSIRPVQSLTPNEMRALKAETGRPLSDFMGGDPGDMDQAPDRLQAMTWVALRREGHRPSWEQAGDVMPDLTEAVEDPTNAGPQNSSSLSAATGG